MSARDMVARHTDYTETKDFIPTPPYATRVLLEEVIPEFRNKPANKELSVWEPACGTGHMSRVFQEYYFGEVLSTDIIDYGWPDTKIGDFRELAEHGHTAYLVATNPPYALMKEFVKYGLEAADRYLALLTRIQFLEGQKRHNEIFSIKPPSKVAVFSDRIPFKQGEVVQKASKMFTHCWVVWDLQDESGECRLEWIHPNAQAKHEQMRDYK